MWLNMIVILMGQETSNLGVHFFFGTNLIDLNSKDNHPQLQIWVGQLAEANGRVSRENAHR